MTGASWPAVLLVLGASCYHASPERACQVRCGLDENNVPALCPADLECNGGVCTQPGGACLIAEPDAPGAFCYGHMFQICVAAPPTMPVTLSGPISTDPGSGACIQMTTMTHDAVCVIMGNTVTIAGDIRVTGAHPLVIVAEQSITIEASIDVSDHPNVPDLPTVPRAAGSPGASCVVGKQAVAATTTDAGGGAGGSFAQLAGSGGTSATSSTGAKAPFGIATPIFEAGCDGSPGAIAGTGPARFGRGGGAFYAIANGDITDIPGIAINASGGGSPISGGSSNIVGGGGGGSGGFIGFDAANVALDGLVIANGGGGAAGTINAGGAGNSPVAMPPLNPAHGGISGVGGGGGSGGCQGDLPSTPCENAPAGVGQDYSSGPAGGGGGSIGFIVVHGSLTGSALFSPPITLLP